MEYLNNTYLNSCHCGALIQTLTHPNLIASQGTEVCKGLSYSSYSLPKWLIMELNFLLSSKVQATLMYPYNPNSEKILICNST